MKLFVSFVITLLVAYIAFVVLSVDTYKIIVPASFSGPGVVVFDCEYSDGFKDGFFYLNEKGVCFTCEDFGGEGYKTYVFYHRQVDGSLVKLDFPSIVSCAYSSKIRRRGGPHKFFIGFSIKSKDGCNQIIPHLSNALDEFEDVMRIDDQ